MLEHTTMTQTQVWDHLRGKTMTQTQTLVLNHLRGKPRLELRSQVTSEENMTQTQTQVSDHLRGKPRLKLKLWSGITSEENHDLNSNSGLRSPQRKIMTQTQIQVSDHPRGKFSLSTVTEPPLFSLYPLPRGTFRG